MARTRSFFTANEGIGKLLILFKESQGSLFHYKCKTIANSIVKNKELQISRADCFLDKQEINYGVSILRESANKILSSEKKQLFGNIINAILPRLKCSYIFCMTQNSNNSYMLTNYGDTIIELDENFSQDFGLTSWHAIPHGDGFQIFHSSNLYSYHEGFVEYDKSNQRQIAVQICQTFNEIEPEKLHIVDHFHFIDIMIKFISLCKQDIYSNEKEYRCILITKDNKSSEFEITMGNRIYLKLRIPTDFKLVNP